MISSIIEAAKPIEATPADRQRYVELLQKSKHSKAEVIEFSELQKRLGYSAAESELHQVVLAEAERLEEITRQEQEAYQDDCQASEAEAAKRKELADKIWALNLTLNTNNFSEAQKYLATQRRCREIIGAKPQLATLYSKWGNLFGLPQAEQSPSSVWIYPAAVAAKMTQLKITNHESNAKKR